MTPRTPLGEIAADFSDPAAEALDWATAELLLAGAEVFWLSSVRPDGRPHVTPLLTIWLDGGLHFCTGTGERKARNLRQNPEVVLTTGTNTLSEGCDLVVEGTAERVTDSAALRTLADAYIAKYGADWTFEVGDGVLDGEGGPALVFRVEPRTVFGFAKDPYAQTRFRFPAAA
ncbi:pyridoxamine 5'-phosphate oxidase family protein [Streptomyces qinzhouensis]|uniref:Pyridoxamine 5'-phosphate oxidase family protein n=1 Tax=Streptomyces qinzhouensis TaxID=2599401 RepID=A0A5B8IDK2_9ACTN|nr:pyridoxamine 5'-phosphate oxidase family protein [Streptomyces qinzhouensis]QDY76468.1 pyridoxamine 5'-phosphate oxidase family protein [Streptomyces qinzhouensis]